MNECTGTALTAASVQRIARHSNFRKMVERCARMGVRVTRTGFTWLIEGGPAGVRFGVLDLSTMTAGDLTSRRRKRGNK
jgi:hypothetical protein